MQRHFDDDEAVWMLRQVPRKPFDLVGKKFVSRPLAPVGSKGTLHAEPRSTGMYPLRIISTLLTALALVPTGAHLFSMASKLHLDGGDYLVSQRAYDNWQMFAVVVISSLLSTLALTVLLYRSGKPYVLAGLSFLCIVGTQIIFWSFTFPANKATESWTMLPDGWEALRSQWEYSHAGSAILNVAALALLVFASTKA